MLAPGAILQGALGCVERVAKRHVDVGVVRVFRSLAAHAYSAAGYDEVDLDVEGRPLAAVSWRRLDDDVTTGDAVVESLEMVDELAYPLGDGGRGIEMPEGQLQGCLHGRLPGSWTAHHVSVGRGCFPSAEGERC